MFRVGLTHGRRGGVDLGHRYGFPVGIVAVVPPLPASVAVQEAAVSCPGVVALSPGVAIAPWSEQVFNDVTREHVFDFLKTKWRC